MADIDNDWYYSDKVKDHFFHPKNFITEEPKEGEFDAMGEVGNFVCGDIMKMWIKIEPKTKKIKTLKWRTWGCATAIASTSAFSEMVTEDGGMIIDEALKITPKDIAERLGGIPDRKFHCSVMADQAFKKAVENYHKNLTQ
jgi:NifU-like protein involved in Fe-S cluster formation